MSDDVRFVILGSCVTRDAFELIGERPWKLQRYMARSGLGSFFGPATASVSPDFEVFQSPFRRRMVEEDLTKSARQWLEQTTYDVLVYDMIDERYPLARFPDGGVCTVSAEFLELGLPEDSYEVIAQDSEEFRERWEAGWAELVAMLTQQGRLDRLVVHDARWAERISGTDDPQFQRPYVRAANAWLAMSMERIRQDIPENQIVTVTPELLAVDPDHRWGLTPFHYIEDYYLDLNDKLAKVTSRGTGESGEPAKVPSLEDCLDGAPSVGEWDEIHVPIPGGMAVDALLKFRGSGLPLLCFLPSAQSSSKWRNPLYLRRSWADSFPKANIVVLSDPGLYVSREVLGSWLCHDEVNLASQVAGVVRAVATKWGVDSSRIILYGSSMGGFEAIRLSAHLLGSRAVAEIPQMDLRKYGDPGAMSSLENHLLKVPMSTDDPDVVQQLSTVDFLRSLDQVPRVRFLTNRWDPAYRQVLSLAEEIEYGTRDGGPLTIDVIGEDLGHAPLGREQVVPILEQELSQVGPLASGLGMTGQPWTWEMFSGDVEVGAMHFSLPVPVTQLRLKVELEVSGDAPLHGALVAWRLSAPPGVDVAAALSQGTSVARSPSEDIGWFTYLSTREKSVSNDLALHATDGVQCTGFSILKWNSGQAEIRLKALSASSRS